MTFLTPLFLLGAAGIILPVIFHLIRRTTREVTPFSSLMFLQPTPPRITKRSRLENLLLLCLRALALILIALGFARPLLHRDDQRPGETGTLKRTVILLDRSASMRRENLWPEAVARAENALRTRQAQDEVALLTFDREVHPLSGFKEWQTGSPAVRVEHAIGALKTVSPSWSGTALGPALLRAAELLEAPARQQHVAREIVLISDLQEGSHVDGLQGFEWPKETTVQLERIEPRQHANASFQWLADSDEGESATPAEKSIRVRVTSTAAAQGEQFELRWAGDAKPPAGAAAPASVAAYVPPGQSRTVRVPLPIGGAPDRLLLSGDDSPFDNTLYVAPPKPQTLTILFAGGDKPDDAKRALYFLQRAFPKTRSQQVQITPKPAGEAIPPWELTSAQLLVLGEGAGGPVIESARAFAESGKIVLVPLATPDDAQALGRLLNRPSISAAEAPVKDYAILSQIDFKHPLFAAFADPRFSDFSRIHFWHYRRIGLADVPDVKVLARFDSGDPAIVQAPLGKGAVVALTSSWRPADSQLALSSKFVPLLHALLDQSGGVIAPRAQYSVGDEIPIPTGQPAYRMQKPDGTSAEVAPGAKFTGTDQPGFYTLTPGSQIIPVNLDPAEGRTTALGDEQLTALGVPLRKATPTVTDTAEQARLRVAAEDESRQKLWHWLLLGAIVFLLGETALAGRREPVHTAASQSVESPTT
jgi:hypothetical protein